MHKVKESTVIPQGNHMYHMVVEYDDGNKRYFEGLTAEGCIKVMGVVDEAKADEIREALKA